MYPVEGSPAAAPPGWSALDRRTRRAVLVGGLAVLVGIVAATALSIRAGQPGGSVYVSAGVGPATLWVSGGSGFRPLRAGGEAPSGNHPDMAFDSARGVLVVWDHGCARLVMGFQGGCGEQVDRTWTWDGSTWSLRSPRSEPVQAGGAGVMGYDSRLGGVVYANTAGQAWSWTGSDWRPLSLSAPAAVAHGNLVALGFDPDHSRIVYVLLDSTWGWDGSHWTRLGGGIDLDDARPEVAALIDDSARGQLIYLGRRFTWTWSGGGWRRHDQPAFTSAAAAFDPRSGVVALLAENPDACDRTACQTVSWSWDGAIWTRQATSGPVLPLGRSGAYPPAVTYDPVHSQLDVLVSAS